MTPTEKAEQFAALHVAGNPLILYNIWDAGSAGAVAKAGVNAVATGSWSVAAAQGFADGEALPLEALLVTVSQIAGAIGDLPLSVDFEGGYADEPERIADNVSRLIRAGAIGINFEDRRVRGKGLFDIEAQQARIRAIRGAAEAEGLPFFINARTDLFFQGPEVEAPSLSEVLERANAYQEAGANGFFVPGLADAERIGNLCQSSPLPVNIMQSGKGPSNSELSALGVSRISYGPGPYRDAMNALTEAARALI